MATETLTSPPIRVNHPVRKLTTGAFAPQPRAWEPTTRSVHGGRPAPCRAARSPRPWRRERRTQRPRGHTRPRRRYLLRHHVVPADQPPRAGRAPLAGQLTAVLRRMLVPEDYAGRPQPPPRWAAP